MLKLSLTLILLLPTTVFAAGGDPLPEPSPKGTPSAVSVYNRGLRLAEGGDFLGAETAYRQAIALDTTLPEAWNGLGHSLKKQKRYPESLAAYDEALRLRPDFPLALQYLGELYVETGQIGKARQILAKLMRLDHAHARTLDAAIDSGTGAW
jgi:tetratricopeptide (TPR) repeat protein